MSPGLEVGVCIEKLGQSTDFLSHDLMLSNAPSGKYVQLLFHYYELQAYPCDTKIRVDRIQRPFVLNECKQDLAWVPCSSIYS